MKSFIITCLLLLAACSPNKTSFAGRAQNAEAGAVINQNGRIMYVDGVKAWPEELLGKKLTVSGYYIKKQYTKPLKEQADLDMVIEKPEWHL